MSAPKSPGHRTSKRRSAGGPTEAEEAAVTQRVEALPHAPRSELEAEWRRLWGPHLPRYASRQYPDQSGRLWPPGGNLWRPRRKDEAPPKEGVRERRQGEDTEAPPFAWYEALTRMAWRDARGPGLGERVRLARQDP